MGNLEAFTGGHINVVTIELVPRRKANGVNDYVDVVPVLVQLFEHIFNFFIAGNVAREDKFTAPSVSKLLYPWFELFILVREGQFRAFTGKGLCNAVCDRQFAGYANNQRFLATEYSHRSFSLCS